MKTIKRLFLSMNILLFSLCSLSSCASDLGGGIKNEEQYGECYEVNFFDSDRSLTYQDDDLEDDAKGVPITNFYNKDSVNDFSCPLEYDTYRYLIIHPTRTVQLDEMYIYVNAETEGVLQCKLYITNYIPSKLVNLANAISEFTTFLNDKDKDASAEFVFDYGDEPSDTASSSATKKLSANTWTDIGFTQYYNSEGRAKSVTVESSQYILIQFYNNVETDIVIKKGMTLDEAKQAVEDRKKNRMNIKITDIILHDAS